MARQSKLEHAIEQVASQIGEHQRQIAALTMALDVLVAQRPTPRTPAATARKELAASTT